MNMSLTQKLFSFEGRIRRRDWWLLGIAVAVVSWILQGIVGAMLGGGLAAAAASGTTPGEAATVTTASIVSLVISLLFMWPGAALSVKRAHDRNRPAIIVFAFYGLSVLLSVLATFTFGSSMVAMGGGANPMEAAGPMGMVIGILGLVVVIYALYLLVELGFLDGTPGPNQYGPSPKGLGGSEAFA